MAGSCGCTFPTDPSTSSRGSTDSSRSSRRASSTRSCRRRCRGSRSPPGSMGGIRCLSPPEPHDPPVARRNLKEYERKRDFAVTPEPAPRPVKRKRGAPAPTFMVHKHHARNLHYDLRLEMDGALASWAVPKGPSYDPAQKRLAVQVEDHPLEYGEFEGRIPEGEYGGGDSIIWDQGTYDTEPPGEASEQRKSGHLKLVFAGEKLRGRWHL